MAEAARDESADDPEGRESSALVRVTANEVAWPEIVSLVSGTMFRIVGNRAECDDLTQTALERIVRSLDQFEGRAQLTTFVYRISVNVALSYWRSWRRWIRRFDPTTDVESTEVEAAGDLETSHAASRRARRLRELLEKIDPDQRMVLVLADFEELSGPEISDLLGIGEPTVRSRLRLARNRLTTLVLRDPVFGEERSR